MPRHPYAGGFRDDIKAQLERIQIPEKVKCKTCKKIRMQNAFSKRQLEDLRNAMLHGATSMSGPGYAKCRQCVGGQTVELTCCMCDKTKGLEHFSKNQRHDPDSARCVNCVQGSLDTDPITDAKDKENASYMSTTESLYDADTVTDPLSRVALNDRVGSGLHTPTGPHAASQPNRVPGHTTNNSVYSDSDSDRGDETGNVTTGVWLNQKAKEEAERKAQEKIARQQNAAASLQNASIPFTGFDPNGVPHARKVVPSVVDSTEQNQAGWGRWAYIRQPRPASNASEPSLQRKRSGGFAKIKGTRFPKDEAVVMHVPEPDGQTVDSDDEDDGEFQYEDWI